ncbi:MAG: winged helix-turn-helix domain-containing protein [Lentisphaeria bacterium]|nr:winged helix-turn-helix domain-containing protein [Lentisphaeria bacterium]
MTKEISCTSCPMKKKIVPGMRYEDSPCSACPLKNDSIIQKKQIIKKNFHAERIIDFLLRLEMIFALPKRKEILFLILRAPGISDKKIAEALGLSRRNVSYHTKLIRSTLPELVKGSSLQAFPEGKEE